METVQNLPTSCSSFKSHRYTPQFKIAVAYQHLSKGIFVLFWVICRLQMKDIRRNIPFLIFIFFIYFILSRFALLNWYNLLETVFTQNILTLHNIKYKSLGDMNIARDLFINKNNSFTACINKKNMHSIKVKMKFSLCPYLLNVSA